MSSQKSGPYDLTKSEEASTIYAVEYTSKSFFVDRSDGISKTFLYNTLLVNVRLPERIAITVTFSEIAMILISSKRTIYF